MPKPILTRAVRVTAPDRTGALKEVLTPIAESKVNLEAFQAFTTGGRASFFLVPEPPAYTAMITTLRKGNVTFEEVECVGVELENRPGQAGWATNALATADINIEACFSSTLPNARTRAFFVTNDNPGAVKALG